jgi:hydroxymethylbilane synthase
MRGPERIVLGTRGSALARAQTLLVEQALREKWPDQEIEIRIIKTRGDENAASADVRHVDTPPVAKTPFAGRKGIFTAALEEALRRNEIDVAVHSAKDLPSDSSNDLEISATLPRAAIADALILKKRGDLESIPDNAIVGTGSVRRQHQLRWKRPGLRLVDLRGNVPTRLDKFTNSDWHAIVLARAGLERLGHDLSLPTFDFDGRVLHVEPLLPPDFLPAGGQGTIAMQTRVGDQRAKQCVLTVNHSTTLLALQAEREFLRLLQADCNSPVGVLATIESQVMTLQAQVFEPPRMEPKMGKVSSSLDEQPPEQIAVALHGWIYEQR